MSKIKTLKFYLEIKIHLNKWRNMLCSGIEITNIIEMSLLPKLIYKFNAILMIILAVFFLNQQMNSKIHMEIQIY